MFQTTNLTSHIYIYIYTVYIIYKVGPPFTIAKLVNVTPITIVYGTQNELVTGVYKPTYNWRGQIVILTWDTWPMLR